MNTKRLSFLILFYLLFFSALIYLAYSKYQENYVRSKIYIDVVDEYGYVTSDGVEYAFKGIYYCSDGKKYDLYNLNDLKGSNIEVEYRVTDDGERKIEKFYINGVECIKGGHKL